MPLPNLFEVCTPRQDVLNGNIASDFAADLALVLNGKASKEYQDAKLFFANTYPTNGLKNLLENVCLRLAGRSEQIASIFRLDTNYGGGKTHALIALSHAAKGMQDVDEKIIKEFINPAFLPQEPVTIAAFDGENADLVNGHDMGDGIRAYTPWGELAYALAGTDGYRQVKKSDELVVAPGAETFRNLFGNSPVLILIDELSIYLRKASGTQKVQQQASQQLPVFLNSLFKAVNESPRAAVVFTLAIGKGDGKAIDAYSHENEAIAKMMNDALSVSAKMATLLDPTEEGETVKVLCRRLFKNIDQNGAKQIVAEYKHLWDINKNHLPGIGLQDNKVDAFQSGFPLHPELISLLQEKTATLGNFQRVRGMLRLLAKTVCQLWKNRPSDCYAIHPHHIDMSVSSIRQEIITKLDQNAFVPALKGDIASVEGDTPSLAEEIDLANYKGLPPYASHVARTIFLNTLAFNENLKGATENQIRYSILSPYMELSFINDALRHFKQESAYLDDKPNQPNQPLRFLTEPNLTQMIHQQERNVDPGDVRARLNDTIKQIFDGKVFNLVAFPSMPKDVDDTNTEKPLLAIMGYEACDIQMNGSNVYIPDLVSRIYCNSSENHLRINRNNLIFVVVDESKVEDMKIRMRRRLALEDMRNPAKQADLADHQKQQLMERYRISEQEVAICVQQTYRHVFYPTCHRLEGAKENLQHTTVEVQNASANPGSGQNQIIRVLQGVNKLRLDGDNPDSPLFIIERTPLKKQGHISTAVLRNEYRRDPALAILASDNIFMRSIRSGIEQGEFVYKNGELVCGKGDPFPIIEISENAEVMTTVYARDNRIWPKELTPPPPPPPILPPIDTKSGKGTGIGTGTETGNGNGNETGQIDTEKTVSSEGVLKQALTVLWEKARSAKFSAIASLELLLIDALDAFTLLRQVATLPNCDKKVALSGSFTTADNSIYELNFEGTTQSASQFKDFLLPQLKASTEKELDVTYTISFANGLSLSGDAPQELSDKLTKIGGVSAFVKATAFRQ